MTVITETLDLPSGASPSTPVVTIQLVGESGVPLREGYSSASSTTIVYLEQPTVTAGAWTITLPGNSVITPSGTRYARTVTIGGTSTRSYIDVPATGGPYRVDQILSDAPASIDNSATSVALAAHIADTTDAHDASAISFSPTGTVAATDVQTAIAEVAAEAAAGGFTQEQIEDFVGAMVTGNTETGIAVTYDDPGAKLNFATEVTTASLATSLGSYVTKALYDANTILAATTDDTPAALTVGASTIVGRKASGNIAAMTPTEAGVVLGLGTAALISSTAGGDLSGTLPSPTVAKINGVAVTGTPSTGYVPTATSPSAATWQAASTTPPIATDVIWDAKGDLAVGTGADTAAKLTVGAAGRTLVADSTQSTGLRWAEARKSWRTAFTSGEYTTPAVNGVAGATGSWGLNQIWYVPYFAPCSFSFDRMRIYQSGTGNFRLGVYNADGANGKPSTLLVDAGVIAGVGAGDKELTGLSQALVGGVWYWLALVGDTTLTIGTVAGAATVPLDVDAPSAGSSKSSYFKTFTYAALPATASISGNVATTYANIQLRAA